MQERDKSPVRKLSQPQPEGVGEHAHTDRLLGCQSECSDDSEHSQRDDDVHHCFDCREKWMSGKGFRCQCCGDFWCPDYDSAFVWLEQCECEDSWKIRKAFAKARGVVDPALSFVCPDCFVKDGIPCIHPECVTSITGLLKEDADMVAKTGNHVHHDALMKALLKKAPS